MYHDILKRRKPTEILKCIFEMGSIYAIIVAPDPRPKQTLIRGNFTACFAAVAKWYAGARTRVEDCHARR